MTRPDSMEIQEQDPIALGAPPALTECAQPPILTEGTRLAPDRDGRGAGPRADGEGAGRRPSDAAALTADNGGGTSGNHGNGTAG